MIGLFLHVSVTHAIVLERYKGVEKLDLKRNNCRVNLCLYRVPFCGFRI